MSNVKPVIENFLSKKDKVEQGRFRSWELCHNKFLKYANTTLTPQDRELLSLHLMGYLASWGMYRGSSFLLQDYDYMIHQGAVDIVMDYPELFQLDPITETKEYVQALFGNGGVYKRLEDYYGKLKSEVKDVKSPTMTLITKILMGVYGCMPAYDRFFVDGLSDDGISVSKQGRPNIENLLKYIKTNESKLKDFYDVLDELNSDGLNYTLMKVIDMYYWQLGFEKDQRAPSSKIY